RRLVDQSRRQLSGDAPEPCDRTDAEPLGQRQAKAGLPHPVARLLEARESLDQIGSQLAHPDLAHDLVHRNLALDLATGPLHRPLKAAQGGAQRRRLLAELVQTRECLCPLAHHRCGPLGVRHTRRSSSPHSWCLSRRSSLRQPGVRNPPRQLSSSKDATEPMLSLHRSRRRRGNVSEPPGSPGGPPAIVKTYGIPAGTVARSGQTITYTVTSAVSVAASVPIYIELSGLTNGTPAGGYTTSVTTQTSAPATIDGPTTSNTVTLAANNTAVTVTLDKSLTFTLDTTAFTLAMDPSLPALADQSQNVGLTIQTNANSGYTLTVADSGTGLQSAGAGNPTIADVSSGKATSVTWP